MLDIKFIRENKELVKQNCIDRRAKVDVDLVLKLDDQRKDLLKQTEELRGLRNAKSKGKPSEEEIKKMREVGDNITTIEKELGEVEMKYLEEMMKIPNLTHPESPIGEEADFKIIYKNFEPKDFDFKPLDHEELMLKNNLIDFERATKTTGTKFYFYKNNLVRLNQALLNYSMDIAAKYGYTLMETPDIAKNEVINGIGFNPRSDEETQIYSLKDTDLSLVGTAEITVGGYHAGEILDLNTKPKKYIALSHCFRTEAGAYGKTSKGLYRVHQFTKLEMFVFCKPEDSEKYHAEILEIEKEILNGLEIPYRVIDIASADLGGPAYRKFDIEGYMTMKGDDKKQGDYGEITSCSNCTDYQARRLNIKYKKEDGTNAYVHTLNGTAVVLSRFPIILTENHQQKDGTIAVPKVLQKYCGFKKL